MQLQHSEKLDQKSAQFQP